MDDFDVEITEALDATDVPDATQDHAAVLTEAATASASPGTAIDWAGEIGEGQFATDSHASTMDAMVEVLAEASADDSHMTFLPMDVAEAATAIDHFCLFVMPDQVDITLWKHFIGVELGFISSTER